VEAAVNAGLLRRLFLRSLFIQAAWNYRGMQHLGLLWAQLPALPEDKEARRAAMARGAEFYNAHPYLCGYLLGAAARLEPQGEGESLSRLKKAALSPLGAVGDRLFWAGLRPLAGAVGVLGLALLAASPSASTQGLYWAVALGALAVLAFNIVHLQWRWRALRDGFDLGLGVAQSIRGLVNHQGLAHTGAALCVLAGLMAPLLGAGAADAGGLPGVLMFLLLLAAGWQLPARRWSLPALLGLLGLLWLLP
jgi:mannose/fructose/N-acetylgalactosamine-specific phosphotransferase system component IID